MPRRLGNELERIAGLIRSSDARGAIHAVEGLLTRAPAGCHLVEPWKVVLAGRPNVGKSSLVNALVGYQRAVVHPAAGTTRDVVSAATAIDGWSIELSDTAGQHAAAEPLEAASMQVARERLAAADLVVLVFDASTGLTAGDEAIAAQWPAALRVWNKADLLGEGATTPRRELLVSALDGRGLDALARAIVERLVPDPPAPGQAVPFISRQVDRLEELGRLLAAGESSLAADLASDRAGWGF